MSLDHDLRRANLGILRTTRELQRYLQDLDSLQRKLGTSELPVGYFCFNNRDLTEVIKKCREREDHKTHVVHIDNPDEDNFPMIVITFWTEIEPEKVVIYLTLVPLNRVQ